MDRRCLIMEPKICVSLERRLIGMFMRTSHSENRTFELWSGFKPRVREIVERLSRDFYSVQIFDEGGTFENFTPTTQFEKWAAVEVPESANIPHAMSVLTIPAGLYAIFTHKGLPSQFPQTAAFIYGNWMPTSGYEVDSRPHFEIMKPEYRHDDPHAEEEIWVPIKKRAQR